MDINVDAVADSSANDLELGDEVTLHPQVVEDYIYHFASNLRVPGRDLAARLVERVQAMVRAYIDGVVVRGVVTGFGALDDDFSDGRRYVRVEHVGVGDPFTAFYSEDVLFLVRPRPQVTEEEK